MTQQPGDPLETTSSTSSPPRLGFNEIIPGLGASEMHRPPQDTGPLIPEFDLDRQMMAQHRRSVAAQRRGPGQQKTSAPVPQAETPVPPVTSAPAAWSSVPAPTYSAVIADIVSRDLARLCSGQWQSSALDNGNGMA